MDNFEALKDMLKRIKENCEISPSFVQFSDNEWHICADALQQLDEVEKQLTELREVNRWVPCSERLPEEEQQVLTISKWGIGIRRQKSGSWYDEFGRASMNISGENEPVTHWKPITTLEGD